MLLSRSLSATFIRKPIVDARSQTEAILALSRRAGKGTTSPAARWRLSGQSRIADDQGFMYTRAFEDPDGHLWETVFMEAPEAAS